MVAIFGLTPRILMIGTIPMTGFFIGKWLDDKETERMTRFRDKSALYIGYRKPGDAPSWP